MKNGKVIAAFGLPGSGKSTVTKEIGALLDIETLHEPEEENWADAVSNRSVSGNFTAIMWFRAIRIPMLFKANEKRKKGGIVMLDSYYDKLFSLYMDKDGMQWLYQKEDLYYDEMKSIAKKDYELLPNVDCLIFFHVDIDTWVKFLKQRNRNLDNEREFRQTCFKSQEYFLLAAKKYSEDTGAKLIVFNQFFSSPKNAAQEVVKELKGRNVID